jgi:hypothetical protein
VRRIGRRTKEKKERATIGLISEATPVQPDGLIQTSNSQIKPDFSCNLIRTQDMIMLKFDFVNMKLNARRNYLRKINKKINAYMIVHFPPQNVAEQAFYQAEEGIAFSHNPNDKTCDIDSLRIMIPFNGNIIDLCLPHPVKGKDQELVLPVKARIGGPSRLVFRISVERIPFTIQDLLDWKRYELSVMSTALPPDSDVSIKRSKKAKRKRLPKISEPLFTQTAIEAPYRLVISPSSNEGWKHSHKAITFGDRTELWHTRLGVVVKDTLNNRNIDEGESTEKDRIIRAIWSPDYSEIAPDRNDEEPFKMSLTRNDRYQLVRLTSDFNMKVDADAHKGKIKINPKPVKVNRLMLSSLGAWMDLMGDWNWERFPKPLNISQWRHRGTQGRDHYVRVVYEGFLFPFGHRASLVKITERKFEDISDTVPAEPDVLSTLPITSTFANKKLVENIEASINYLSAFLNVVKPMGNEKENYVPLSNITKSSKQTIKPLTAILRQRMFLIVKEPVKVYKPEGRMYEGKLWPFRKVRVKTLVTPNIDPPQDFAVEINSVNYGQTAFWPAVGGKLFKFHLVAEDVNDRSVEINMPLIFVDYPAVEKGGNFREILEPRGSGEEPLRDYLKKADIMERMKPYIYGQKVSLAQSNPNETSTTFETNLIHFGYEYFKEFPCFLPTLMEADITLSSVKQILGEDTSVKVSFSEVYLNNGFDSNNKGQVFLKLENPLEVSFSKDVNKPGKADKSGGIVTPNLSITRISKAQGPVGGTNTEFEKDAKFNPSDYFGAALDAKILGSVSLSYVLAEIPNVFADPKNSCPKFTTEMGSSGEMVTSLTWTTMAFKDPIDEDIFKKRVGKPLELSTSLELSNIITKSKDSEKSSYEVYGVLQNFDINLLGLITIPFERFEFHSWNGKKSDVNIIIDPKQGILFGGALQFINELKDFIPSSGFSDPPSLEVTQEGIKAGYSLGIPTISMGIFSIQNISLSAGLMIPFTGQPVRVRFAFSEREHPFIVTVSLFGGGGFFGIAVGADGIEMFEAALEFGGNISLDIGVASGGVYIMAGFYFKSDGNKGAVLEGYLRAGGELEILGLISISLEFYLGMKYLEATNSVWGRATMTVEVEVAFFSKSVELTVEREFARSGPPSFEDMISLQEWEEYCGAFA